MTPFDDAQFAEIGRNMAAMMQQRKSVPDAPEGFARVLIYSDVALAGAAMPRVRLAPMAMPPKKRKGHKEQNKGQKQHLVNTSGSNSPASSPASSPGNAIYLSYTDAGGVAPFFQTLDDEDGLMLVKASAPMMGRVATVLHTRGKEGDAPLEIVCVTDAPIDRPQAEAISQAAINYAMETGLIPMQRDEPPQGGQEGQGYGFSPN